MSVQTKLNTKLSLPSCLHQSKLHTLTKYKHQTKYQAVLDSTHRDLSFKISMDVPININK